MHSSDIVDISRLIDLRELHMVDWLEDESQREGITEVTTAIAKRLKKLRQFHILYSPIDCIQPFVQFSETLRSIVVENLSNFRNLNLVELNRARRRSFAHRHRGVILYMKDI